jgi:hypothetical protein
MSPAPLNQNIFDRNLSAVFDSKIRAMMLSFNCHAVANVTSFDPSNMTVNATMNYPKTFYRPDPVTGVIGPVTIQYPVLAQCPVMFPQGGGFAFTFAPKAGDTCVILFNDRSLSNWFATGQVLPLNSNRLHAFQDAMAFPGLRSKNNPIPNFDSDHGCICAIDGTAKVGVSTDKVLITNGVTLNTILQNLVTALEDLTVICSTPGNPSSPPVNVAAITAIGTQLGALLE